AGVYDVMLTVIDRDGGVATKGFTVHVGPPAVVAVERNGGLPTPYELTSLAIAFSDDVPTVGVGDLALFNNSTGEVVDLTGLTPAEFNYNSETYIATWNLSSLVLDEAGFYTATVSAAGVIDNYARMLDGDMDGTGGDDYQNVMVIAMPGDSNVDGRVDRDDFQTLKARFGISHATWYDGDSNHDGHVNFHDYLTYKVQVGKAVSFEYPTPPAPKPAVEAVEPAVEAAEPAVEAVEPVAEVPEAIVEAPEPIVEAAEAIVEAPEPIVEAPEPAGLTADGMSDALLAAEAALWNERQSAGIEPVLPSGAAEDDAFDALLSVSLYDEAAGVGSLSPTDRPSPIGLLGSTVEEPVMDRPEGPAAATLAEDALDVLAVPKLDVPGLGIRTS
ncbi:MAG: hypothetical protein WBF17_23970, partial [Phycisphaerae bacterium]